MVGVVNDTFGFLHQISQKWCFICYHLKVVDCKLDIGSASHCQQVKHLEKSYEGM